METKTDNNSIHSSFKSLCSSITDFVLSSDVPRVSSMTALSFLRDFVMPSRPCIFTDSSYGVYDTAMTLWSTKHLKHVMGNQHIHVAWTPNGLADAPLSYEGETRGYFVLPEERIMTLNEFLDNMERHDDDDVDGVLYVQQQNGNMHTDFNPLAEDVSSDVGFASEAFGRLPDAVNIWLGPDEARSSLHRDPYENLYAVISGSKTFVLYPPSDIHAMDYQEYHVARYRSYPLSPYSNHTEEEVSKEDVIATGNGYKVIVEKPESVVPWIPIDPYVDADLLKMRHPFISDTSGPYFVTVNAGEMLNLPQFWFHHVSQSCDQHSKTPGYTVAVNWWYDADFKTQYCWQRFAETLLPTLKREYDLYKATLSELR